MATLSQLVLGVQGLTGNNSFDKQKQLYERLGSPLGAYTGSYNQNNWLLNNQNRWSQAAPSQPTPAAPQDPYDTLKQTILGSQALKAIKPFEDTTPFSNFFNEDLTRQTVANLYQPDFQRENTQALDSYNKGVSANDQTYANNGALFGGARQGSLAELMKQKEQQDFERQRAQNRTVEGQVMNERTFKQKQYEDEKNNYLKNPTYI